MRLGRSRRAWSPAAGTCTVGAGVREDGSCREYPGWEGEGWRIVPLSWWTVSLAPQGSGHFWDLSLLPTDLQSTDLVHSLRWVLGGLLLLLTSGDTRALRQKPLPWSHTRKDLGLAPDTWRARRPGE